MKDYLIAILWAVLIVALLTVGGLNLAMWQERTKCSNTAVEMGVNWRYGLWTKCRVEIDGRFVLLENVRFVE